MTRTKTPSPAACLHEQTVRHHCRALKMPTVAGQFETLAQAAIREGHGHVQYLDALLTAEIEERERKGVVRRIQEAHLPRVKTLAEFDFRQSSAASGLVLPDCGRCPRSFTRRIAPSHVRIAALG